MPLGLFQELYFSFYLHAIFGNPLFLFFFFFFKYLYFIIMVLSYSKSGHSNNLRCLCKSWSGLD